jgi:nitrite reductase/ring-hydroxylating ferredoxin subunit
MAAGERICDADRLESDSLLFTVREEASGTEREAILLRVGDGVRGWFNYCQHWTDVRLDTGDGVLGRGGDIRCGKHGATFDPASGVCDFGPCEGAVLESIAVAEHDGAIVLVDEDYTLTGTGPLDRDPLDRSTSPGDRVGF